MRSTGGRVGWALWWGWALASSAVQAQDRVDAVVAVVAGRPLTSSEVVFEKEIRALAGTGGNPEAFGLSLTLPDPVEALLVRVALLRGAAPGSSIDLEVATDRAERLQKKMGEVEFRAFLRRWGMAPEDLVAWFREDVRAEAVAEARMDLDSLKEAVPPPLAEPPSGEDASSMDSLALEAGQARERRLRAYRKVADDALSRVDARRFAPSSSSP